MINDLLNKKILITGGAGFIGSNIIDYLISNNHQNIIVLDNLSTGNLSNIENYLSKINLINGDITNFEDCLNATANCDIVLHQAALGSVPRSIENPLDTHNTNVTGFVNMLQASKQNKVTRFVYASSSSVYGDDQNLPKVESKVGKPLSPYAVSKKANELYAEVFADLYKLEVIGLRYFNVFGPKQNPNGPYAAVIPIFINAILKSKCASIFGDGSNRRDFTYIDNVVQANILAATTQNKNALNQVYNIAYGSTKSVNDLYTFIKQKLASEINANYLPPRVGEIKDSFASITKANELLNYKPTVNLEEGIEKAINWYKQNSFK